MSQLRIVDYVGDSDLTDEDLTPLSNPSTLSPPLQNSHITTHSHPAPAPAGVDMMGLSATKPLRTSNSTEPTEPLSLSQVESAPEVNPPVPSPPRVRKSRERRLVSYYDAGPSDSEDNADSPSPSDQTSNHASLREMPGSKDDQSPLPLNGSSPGTESPVETPRKGVLYSVMFPPDPAGRCSNSLQDKVMRALENNFSFNKSVEQDKDFRNPSIYEKMIEFCGIDEYGTNYPTHLFDPSLWRETGGYENLRRLQKEGYDRKQKARIEAASRAKIEFVTANSAKRSTQQDEVNGDKKKKSKWDLSPSN